MSNAQGILTGLFIHPVKGALAVSMPEAAATPRGLQGDRRWMVVDQDGTFLTQRNEPRLTQLHASCVDASGTITLSAPERPTLTVSPPSLAATRIPTDVWDDTVDTQLADAEANAWLGDWLGRPVWLAWLPDTSPRPTRRAPDVDVSLADSYPYLLCSEDSLDDLNTRIDGDPVPMDRFRTNLVVRGFEPWAEDGWRRLRIGEMEFENVKPCARCVVTTTDQASGERRGREPLATLATFREGEEGVNFGTNLVARSGGVLRVGDSVEIL